MRESQFLFPRCQNDFSSRERMSEGKREREREFAHTFFSAMQLDCNQYLSTHATVNVPFGCNKIQIKQHKEKHLQMIIKSCVTSTLAPKWIIRCCICSIMQYTLYLLLLFIFKCTVEAQWPLNGCFATNHVCRCCCCRYSFAQVLYYSRYVTYLSLSC